MIGKLISNLGRAPAGPSEPGAGPGSAAGQHAEAGAAEAAMPGLPGLPEGLPPVAALLQRVIDGLHSDLDAGNLLAAQTLMQATLAQPQFNDPKRLERAGFKGYSQNDEDGILQEIFRRIGAPHKSFVEFGCGNGMENNSSYLLQQGWRGLWLDGSDVNGAFITEQFAHLIRHGLLQFQCTFITRENIDGLIAAAVTRAGRESAPVLMRRALRPAPCARHGGTPLQTLFHRAGEFSPGAPPAARRIRNTVRPPPSTGRHRAPAAPAGW